MISLSDSLTCCFGQLNTCTCVLVMKTNELFSLSTILYKSCKDIFKNVSISYIRYIPRVQFWLNKTVSNHAGLILKNHYLKDSLHAFYSFMLILKIFLIISNYNCIGENHTFNTKETIKSINLFRVSGQEFQNSETSINAQIEWSWLLTLFIKPTRRIFWPFP